jgi:transcriptional regulator NrdR family protein
MKCPFCKSEDHRVIDTRRYDTVIIRIRLCLKCKFSFETIELLRANAPYSSQIITTLLP